MVFGLENDIFYASMTFVYFFHLDTMSFSDDDRNTEN